MVESVLHSGLDDRPLPVVIYLDDIAMYGDTQEEVLEDTLEAVKQLAAASFMLNLHKSQLIQASAQVLGHLWTLGGFWVPNVTKLATLMEKTDGELARFNWASLYGLLNFYREYVRPSLSWLSHCTNSWARTPMSVDTRSRGMHL